MNSETRQEAELRLFRMIRDSKPAVQLLCKSDDPDLDILRALDLAGFINGDFGTASEGIYYLDAHLTAIGHSRLETLEAEASEKTSLGFIKKHRFAAYNWIFGIIAGIIIGYILGKISS